MMRRSLYTKPRKTALIALEHLRDKDPAISLGLSSLMAPFRHPDFRHLRDSVESFSFNCNTQDLNPRSPALPKPGVDREFVDDICHSVLTHHETGPFNTVFIGEFVWNEPYVQALIPELKKHGIKKVGIAGPQVIYCMRGTLSKYYPQADFFIRGNAEAPILQYVRGDTGKINGLNHRLSDDGSVARYTDLPEALVKHAPEYSSPHLQGLITLKNTLSATGTRQKFARMETQRGCPFACTFCQHPGTQGVFEFPKQRIREEFKLLQQEGVTHLNILDPTFNINPAWSEFVIGLFWPSLTVSLQVRPEKLQKRFIECCAKSDAKKIIFELGVQTTNVAELSAVERVKGGDSEKLQKQVHRKVQELDQFIRDHQIKNIAFEISLISGLPHQTLDSLRQSVEDCSKLNADKLSVFPLMLLRGTPLYNRKDTIFLHPSRASSSSQPLIESIIPPEFPYPPELHVQQFIPHVLQTPTMSMKDMQVAAEIATSLVSMKK